jgi:hypothetical protein
MSLTILNTIIDEEIARPGTTGTLDEHDVSTATFDASNFKAALTTLAIPAVQFLSTTGFPQYAEKTSFVSSSNPVTDYFLTGSATGTPLSASGTATLLKVGDTTVFLFPTSNPDIVIGRVGTEGGASPDTASASGAIAFIIGIEETKAAGFVTQADMWIALYSNLTHNGTDLVDSADQLDLANLVYLGSSFDTTTNIPFENFDGVPSGNNLFNVIFPSNGSSAVQLLLTGSAGAALSTVNVSTTGIGAGSQHIDVNATLRIDTVQGMVKANVDAAPEVNQAGNIAYTDTADAGTDARVELVGADFEITQVNPGSASARVDIRLSAFNVAGQDQGQTYLNNINVNGTSVQIDAADIIVKNGAGTDITSTLTITQDGNSVIIRGLDDGTAGDKNDGYQVFFTTDGVRFDRMLITNIDGEGSTFDVGNIHVTAVEGGSATEFAELGSRLKFQDDGPSITASGATLSALTDDDSTFATNASASFAGLFNTPNAGADAPASVGYTLGVTLSGGSAPNSGLVETATGDSIFLFFESGIVRGRSGDNAGAAASGPIVFEISVNSSGLVTLDQKGAVFHTDNNLHDSTSSAMTAGLITLTATVSDSEPDATDDSASASANIGNLFLFKDDGPVLTAQAAGSGTPNNLQVDNNLSDAADSTDFSSYGLLPGNDGQKSYTIVGPEDALGTFRWTYDDATMTSITGTVRVGTTDQDLYTLVLNPATGRYDFTMIGSVPGTQLSLDVNDIKAGGPNSNSIVVGALDDPRSIEIAATGGPINESNDNVGVTNGNLDSGEALTFRLLNGTTEIDFQGISIGTKTASGGTYNWSATPAAGGAALTGSVTILKNAAIVITPAMLGNVLIDSITITKADGSTTKIGLDDIDIFVPPNDIQLGFTVELKDGDNDTTTQSFVVDIDADNDGDWESNVSALSLPLQDSSVFMSSMTLTAHHDNLFGL